MEKVDVLDHGFVELVDVFGNDARVAEVARGSYGNGTKSVSTDEQLVRYLIRHEHSSPVEFCQLIFHMKMPIFVARQLVRHRTIKMNEMSLRYSVAPEEMHLPEAAQLSPQSTNNKQGRAAFASVADEWYANWAHDQIEKHNIEARATYESMLEVNISRELARSVLPLSQYTEMSVSWDLRNLLGFLKLRLHPHAQYEIRVYAQAIHQLTKAKFPVTVKAWEDYILHAKTLSVFDQELLCRFIATGNIPTPEEGDQLGMSKREYNDSVAWLSTLPSRSY